MWANGFVELYSRCFSLLHFHSIRAFVARYDAQAVELELSELSTRLQRAVEAHSKQHWNETTPAQRTVGESALLAVVGALRSEYQNNRRGNEERILSILDGAGFGDHFASLEPHDALLARSAEMGGYSYQLRHEITKIHPVDDQRIGRNVVVPIPHPCCAVSTRYAVIEPKKKKSLLDDSKVFSHPKKADRSQMR